MKRIGNLYGKIIDKENIRRAHHNARKGKSHYKEVKKVNANEDKYINEIHDMLKNKTFRNAEYKVFQRQTSGKLRTIHKLPYYPDRIIQHAILQVLEPIWKKVLIRETYQSIKGRGVHDAKYRVERIIRAERPKYCLKIDIKKFYPSVDNEIMRSIIRRKIKCPETLWLLYEIIDSTQGLPIGNYISQYFGNLYLAYFDHWVKEHHAKHYFRYADDIVIFHNDKNHLHKVLKAIQVYLNDNLNLRLKENYQVFPVASRGVDFLGYVFHHDYTLVRKSIKESFIRKALKYQKKETEGLKKSLASYYGWLVHCNSYNLRKKYLRHDLFSSSKKQERAA